MAYSINLRAFLDTLAWSEGTDNNTQFTYNKGYDVMVGQKLLFHSYRDHPRTIIPLSATLSSSAAGRYQILQKTYDDYKVKTGVKDFSPASQDAIAVRLIKDRKALEDVEAGRFEEAVKKCNTIWASLPGSPYGQRTHQMEPLKAIFMTRQIAYK